MRVPEEERGKRAEKLFEKRMVPNFQNLKNVYTNVRSSMNLN